MSKKLVIIGAGEFAAIAYEYFTYDSDYSVVAFAVEKEYLISDHYYGLPLVDIDELTKLYPPDDFHAFVAIPASNLNQLRTRFFYRLKAEGYTLATYISSHAFVWRNAEIGENCFIFENNTIQPFVKVKDNVIVWSGNHIGHQSIVNAHVFISSHVVISGYCNIGEGCFLGVNSTFNDHTSIAPYCILGSTSLVNKNLEEENKVYIGSPAKAVPKMIAKNVNL
ncbi:acetyltransferase [Aeromonas veronii]|uniref:acetyltransferase n=1 Tax=Aeromonas veronii TaxID=654 RepID=UPI00211D3EC4|nr:acetyltransferase [Aeromonas veronii]UUM70155.1 acetyltransferase [Aeromonas veronii]